MGARFAELTEAAMVGLAGMLMLGCVISALAGLAIPVVLIIWLIQVVS